MNLHQPSPLTLKPAGRELSFCRGFSRHHFKKGERSRSKFTAHSGKPLLRVLSLCFSKTHIGSENSHSRCVMCQR